ncbi:hypothetical protein ONZ45_g12607 [Pleurotus djamor]|nr:hypothetical protein ONZ45_g12607 [Pleurotus djamor]
MKEKRPGPSLVVGFAFEFASACFAKYTVISSVRAFIGLLPRSTSLLHATTVPIFLQYVLMLAQVGRWLDMGNNRASLARKRADPPPPTGRTNTNMISAIAFYPTTTRPLAAAHNVVASNQVRTTPLDADEPSG